MTTRHTQPTPTHRPADPATTPPPLRIDLDTVTSTLDAAREHLADLAPTATLALTARRQTAGRGRHGRAWHSPDGGAWITLATRISSLESVGPLSLLAALATADAINHALATTAASIRWPNDLLLRSEKVAGVLGETHAHGPDRFLLLGIGVNVNNPPPGASQPLRTPATSLTAEAGHDIDLTAFIADLVDRVATTWAGRGTAGPALSPAEIDRIDRRLAYLNRGVRVEGSLTIPNGRVRGIDHAGALLIETEQGLRRVLSGEVSCRPR